MNFLVISFTALCFIIIVLLLRQKGQQTDGKETLLRYIKDDEEAVVAEYEELDKSFYSRMIAPLVEKINIRIQSSAQRRSSNQAVRTEKAKEKVRGTEKLLRMSGMHTSYENYRFGKIAFSTIFSIVVIGFALVLKLDIGKAAMVMGGGILLAVVLPDFMLKSQVKSHQQAIKNQLPDVIDLLGVCMAAGLSFDGAIVKISEKMEGPFIDELMTAFKQIQMGVPRAAALNEISECSDINELKTLMSALVQASTLGIPVTNIIEVQSKQLRDTRRESAKEKGNKAPVKISIPILLMIFPALLVVVLGPSMINLIGTFKGGS